MCPPGVDQTMRGSQHWRMIAPELLQYCGIEADEETRSLDLRVKLLNPNICWDAWGKLARPIVSSPPILDRALLFTVTKKSRNGRPSKKLRAISRVLTDKTLSPLERLSNELLDIIVEQLDAQKVDIIAFGLSSQRLLEIIFRHIHAGYSKSASSWAGKKIAFQGSYSTDLPEGFTENGLADSITGKDWFGNMCAARRFLWQNNIAPITPQSEEAGWREAIGKHHSDGMVSIQTLRLIEEQLGYSYLFPKNQHWLLRNLTTREIVSSEQLSALSACKVKRGKVKPLRFDDVLLIRTCWTSIPSHDEDKLRVHRGAWAGHRFDIITAKSHHEEETAESWCDVTDVVVKEAKVLGGKLSKATIR